VKITVDSHTSPRDYSYIEPGTKEGKEMETFYMNTISGDVATKEEWIESEVSK
jgi:hypothetical protein